MEYKFPIATSKERLTAMVLTLCLSLILTPGFLPSITELWEHLAKLRSGGANEIYEWGREWTFPLFSYVLFRSLGRHGTKWSVEAPAWDLWRISILPLVIALIYGLVRRYFMAPLAGPNWMWTLVCIPLGEEYLFRGWFYGIVSRTHAGKRWSATNPLPVELWMSALAFSLWHLQNWDFAGAPVTLFQVAYTFFVGLWLGVLRWKTKTMTAPILAHFAINALAR